ncbi:MAG: PilZ domain-containing protein [Sphingomicrobium sp.]
MRVYPFHGDMIGRRGAREAATAAVDAARGDAPDAPASVPKHPAAADLAERDDRRSTELTAHLLRGSGEIVDVDLCDLSYDGAKVRTPSYLWQDERLKLSVPRRGVINCDVRWCTEGHAGLRFEPEEVVEKPIVDRIEQRIETRGEILLRRIGANSFRVDIHDFSRFGCRVELVERPRIDEVMLVRFEGLEALDARAKWVDGFVAGLQFERPIHVAVFDILKDRIARETR